MDAICLMILHALPVAWLAWTLTHEEIFRDWWEFCSKVSKEHKQRLDQMRQTPGTYPLPRRVKHWALHKLCFLFTCEYCVSFWVNGVVNLVTGFSVAYDGWQGRALAVFGVPWIAVLMMDVHQRLRVEIRKERAEADLAEKKL